MIHFAKAFYKPVIVMGVLSCLVSAALPVTKANAHSRRPVPAYITNSQKFGEWRYLAQHDAPPTLMWWNDRMDNAVPVLYMEFLPDRIILNAVTPNWPDTGILFYIKDRQDKDAVNLTLLKKDKDHSYYSATVYDGDRHGFIEMLTHSRKARLITPSSYSQSLSLKHVDQAVKTLLSGHPELQGY